MKLRKYHYEQFLFKEKEPRDFVRAIADLSPLFIKIVLEQIDGLTISKLGELLGIENLMDSKMVKDELLRLRGMAP